jgi:hypothetical protein
MIFSLNTLSYHSNPWGIKVWSKEERRGELGELLGVVSELLRMSPHY